MDTDIRDFFPQDYESEHPAYIIFRDMEQLPRSGYGKWVDFMSAKFSAIPWSSSGFRAE